VCAGLLQGHHIMMAGQLFTSFIFSALRARTTRGGDGPRKCVITELLCILLPELPASLFK
jgi:hypothetical protein